MVSERSRILCIALIFGMLVPLPVFAQDYNRELYYYRSYVDRLNGPLIPEKVPLQNRYGKSRQKEYTNAPRPKTKPGELPPHEQENNPFIDKKENTVRQQLLKIEQDNRKSKLLAQDEKRAEEREKKLLERKERTEIKHKKRIQELFAAIYAGDLPGAQKMLDLGIDPNVEHDGYTPLHYAAYLRKLDIITMLLHNPRVRIGTEANLYYTLLHWGAYENHMDIVRQLVQRGANVNIKDERNLTPLDYAKSQKHEDMVKFLRREMEQ